MRAARLFIVDTAANTIYAARGDFVPGTVCTEAPSDSKVASFVGTEDLSSGTITPVITGLSSLSGLLFDPITCGVLGYGDNGQGQDANN
jgi:hypothetical protein